MAESAEVKDPKPDNPYYCYKCKKSVNVKRKQGKLVCQLCSLIYVEDMARARRKNPYIDDSSSESDDSLDDLAVLEGSQTKGLFGLMLDYMKSGREKKEARRRKREQNEGTEREPERGPDESSGGIERSEAPLTLTRGQYLRATGLFAATAHMDDTARRNMGAVLKYTSLPGSEFELLADMLMNVGYERPSEEPKEDLYVTNLETVVVSEEEVAKGLQCSVCMENYSVKDPAKKLNCGHIYHEKCLRPWLERKDTCPNCRTEVDPEIPTRSQSCPRTGPQPRSPILSHLRLESDRRTSPPRNQEPNHRDRYYNIFK